MKVKIQINSLDEEKTFLSILKKYYTLNIYLFYQKSKIPFIKKNWLEVKFWREIPMLTPDDQTHLKSDINIKITVMFKIELETWNEVYKLRTENYSLGKNL
jgi:hypothetical protein